jgi:O-antigen ligase
MLLAQSRSTLLSLVVAMIAWQLSAWLLHKEGSHNHRNRLLFVLALMTVVISALFIVNPEYFKLAFLRKASYGYRLEMWGQLLVQIKNAPWFGHGLNADARTIASDGALHIHPHSVYVGTLLYGILCMANLRHPRTGVQGVRL